MKIKKTAAPRRLADADLGAVAGAISVGEPCCGTGPHPFPWPLPPDPGPKMIIYGPPLSPPGHIVPL